jgi:hypothetical protein
MQDGKSTRDLGCDKDSTVRKSKRRRAIYSPIPEITSRTIPPSTTLEKTVAKRACAMHMRKRAKTAAADHVCTVKGSGKAEPQVARDGRPLWSEQRQLLRQQCKEQDVDSDPRLATALKWRMGTCSSLFSSKHWLRAISFLSNCIYASWHVESTHFLIFFAGAQNESLLRFFHMRLKFGHICDQIFSDSARREDSAFGFLGFKVADDHAGSFFKGLLDLFGISPEEFHNKESNRQEAVLAALSRFGVKPDVEGAFKWVKAYEGKIPFVFDPTKRNQEKQKGGKKKAA